MFIPTPVQELHLPLTQKLEVTPIAPVTAVPGVPEDAQSLDSRVALQWTQPVFAGSEGQAGRSALVAPLPPSLLQSPKAAVPGFQPQGADPDALKAGDVHPLLAQGLSTWLSGVLTKTNGNININSNINGNAAILIPFILNLADPTSAKPKGNELKSPSSTDVQNHLKNIYQFITKSDAFAAQHLNQVWLSKRDESFQEPSSEQLTQWVSALEPDNDAAQQAARMLTQGNMVWQAELVPGVPMRIVREDAWRNNPQQTDQIEKGAMLKVEITLPNLGQLRILGSQWGQDISMQILHGKPEVNGKVNWSSLAPELLQELKTHGVTDVRVGQLPDEAVSPSDEGSPNV
jgi:hypothetical protein